MAAKCVATSEDKSVGLPVGLSNELKGKHPFIIYAWKEQTYNIREFMSRVALMHLMKVRLKKSLWEAGVTEMVLFLGACDKQIQESLVKLCL